MNKLASGVKRFQREVFSLHKKLFSKLARQQAPHTLFITCSDSRILPSMLTQTKPGEIFILRNAGNIIPPFLSPLNGEAAAIEFAIKGLKVENVVVCGHSHCGAIKALLSPNAEYPMLAAWLRYAEPALAHGSVSEKENLTAITRANIVTQLEHLQTHPAVREALASKSLTLHGWMYDIASGNVLNYDFLRKKFTTLEEGHRALPHRDHLADATTEQI